MAPQIEHPLAQSNPDYETLTFIDGHATREKGYVNVSRIYSMDWSLAEYYWNGDTPGRAFFTLDAPSMRRLLSVAERLTGYRPLSTIDSTQPTAAASITPTAAMPHIPPYSVTSSDFDVDAILTTADRARVQPCVVPMPGAMVYAGTSHDHRLADHNIEREPLLARSTGGSGPGKDRSSAGFFTWLWEYLKRTRLGIIIRFLSCRQ